MRYAILFLVLSFVTAGAHAQTGSFSYTVTTNAGKKVSKQQAQPLYKFNNYDCYWFVNPNTGDRHFFVNGVGNMGIIILDDKVNDVDLVYQPQYHGDQLQLLSPDNQATLKADNDKGPIHIHYSVFTAGEIAFTFKGPVTIGAGVGGDESYGVINGSLHLYREPKYEKSELNPACKCDPTIYATSYTEDVGRSPSACENALLWKVFNTVQAAWSKVLPALNYSGPSPAPEGSFVYREGGGFMDITGAPSTVEPCNPLNKTRALVGVHAQERIFTQDNYGMNFIRLPLSAEMNAGANSTDMQKFATAIAATQDSISKLVAAKKLAPEKAAAILSARMTSLMTPQKQPDFKKLEVESSLSIKLEVNAPEAGVMLKLASPSQEVRELHNIKGAAFALSTLQVKTDDSDGSWLPNKVYIFIGKFAPPVKGETAIGLPARIVKPLYPPNAPRLAVYNMVLKLEGRMEMIEIALKNMDLIDLTF